MSDKSKPKKPPRVESVRPCPLEDVINKYIKFGWKIVVPPRGGINDIIAQKDKKMHFVQVVMDEMQTDAKFSGEAQNNFIQNAMSNMGVPIYARIGSVRKKNADGSKAINNTITFEDVNLKSRVIIGCVKKEVPAHERL